MKVSKIVKGTLITGGVLCALKGFDNRLEITHYEMESEKIPKSFDGFKLLQLSDYHAESMPGLIAAVRDECPDVIVTTGDMVHDKGSFLPGVHLYEKLIPVAPIYAVTGNHDIWRSDYNKYEQAISKIGVRTLHNERIIIAHEDGSVGISGIDDPFSQDNEKITKFLNDALSSFDYFENYDILLFHRANIMDRLKHEEFDLILSGHMHGGQFRLPGVGGVVAPKSSWSSTKSAFFPKYFGGHYKSTTTDMIVNRGLGNPMIIPRLFNRPEITVVTLRSLQD